MMDAKEAIEYFKEQTNEPIPGCRRIGKSYRQEAYKAAIESLEKQVPQEPILQPDEEPPFEFEHYRCPNCRCIIHQHYKQSRQPRGKFVKICPECGQAIKNDKE